MGNLTVPSGRALLDVLAMDSDEADEFRRFILRQSTTYHGNADGWYVFSFSATKGISIYADPLHSLVLHSSGPFLGHPCTHSCGVRSQ